MLFESSFYGRDYGQNLCSFFQKKKRNAYLPTQILNLKKWEPRNFFIMALYLQCNLNLGCAAEHIINCMMSMLWGFPHMCYITGETMIFPGMPVV